MNGAPPPPDVPPPGALEAFLGLAIGTALLFALLWFVAVQREIRREREHEDKLRVTREAIESHREELIQWMIDQSPGGRKPWQDRRGDS